MVSYARDAGERARRAAGGGAFYAAVAARDAARDAAEATKDSAAVAAYESAVALIGPLGGCGAGNAGAACGLEGTGGRGRGEVCGGGMGGSFNTSPAGGIVSGHAKLANRPREDERGSPIASKNAIVCFGEAGGNTSLLGKVVGVRQTAGGSIP